MNKEQQTYIIKSGGDRVLYERDKLIQALTNSGADINQSRNIAIKVEQQLYDGIPSRKIYQIAYSMLKKESHRSAGRYRLKKAILEMGPSGYPFEIFIGRLFETLGYQVEVGKVMQGKCIQHEVDVVAHKPGEKVIVECKFHSDYRAKTNVQVPLYIHSRFNDIKEKWLENYSEEEIRFRGYVVTSTRFSRDAIQFAECAGLELISWDYPAKSSLKYFIDQSGLHPLTSLHSLNKTQKRQMLEEGVVLCSELINRPEVMKKYSFSQQHIDKVIKEATLLIK